ncbi:putative ribosome-binding factor A, mitochondrial [Xenopus laevis]|uniref:Ribosome-binding factor A, mitochondrial n=2 Tax=Xenopus laevis TaxID=8355 RepID=A0A1L8FSG9_XENLA|nr:putative ribosome-binding factor A, mitochondrial [Xenopus laevis]OCT74540.1 hypothetical protein XELAEV_18033523mg [Xenopus laevis]
MAGIRLLNAAKRLAWAEPFDLLRCHGPVSQHCRHVHFSVTLPAKNMLGKFANKSKRKFWYDGPSLGSPFANNPATLANLMKVQRKEKREDSIRIRALNTILYKALTDLLQTSAISQETSDINVELSKVSVSADFSVCRAYWMTSGSPDTDDQIELLLQKYAPKFRHLMLTHQVLGSVPTVVFVRDKENAMVQEVEKLLAIADFGEDCDRDMNSTSSGSTAVSQVPTASMFGIDHADLNKQILDYKRKMKDKIKEKDESTLSLKQQEQLAEIRKQKMLKKKKHKGTLHDDDDSVEKYLLSKYNDLYPDEEAVVSEGNEIEYELEEEIKKLEEEDNSDPHVQNKNC